MHQKLKEIVIGRYGDVEEFLSDDLREIPDFSLLKDMDKAAKRLADAVKNGEKVALYGDYDADGTTSIATLAWFLDSLGHQNFMTLQPSRFEEGYGLHASLIDEAVKEGCSLIITMDCGISSTEAQKHARQVGIDLVVTDHHTDGEKEAGCAYAVVNPKRRDQPRVEGLMNLCGAGLAFALAAQTKKELNAQVSVADLLQFTAIGTIGDMVKLDHTNLRIVRHGLRRIKGRPLPGIQALLPPEDLRFSGSDLIGFRLAPIINAKGRLGSPRQALDLLMEKDFHEAQLKAKELLKNNQERKDIQRASKKRALEILAKNPPKVDEPVVVYDPTFHEGVIGLVASTLMRLYQRPAIVLAPTEGSDVLKASARGPEGHNLYAYLLQAQELYLGFGGHKGACGLSIKKDDLERFRRKLAQAPTPTGKSRPADIEMCPSEVDWGFVRGLLSLEPFGMGNEKPLFETTALLKAGEYKKNEHFAGQLEGAEGDFSAMFFNCRDAKAAADSKLPHELLGKRVKIKYSVNPSVWMGRESIKFFIEELSEA